MLILYTAQSCFTAGEVISTDLYSASIGVTPRASGAERVAYVHKNNCHLLFFNLMERRLCISCRLCVKFNTFYDPISSDYNISRQLQTHIPSFVSLIEL